jgi:RNA polymerase sigma factor (sigma-70 family)
VEFSATSSDKSWSNGPLMMDDRALVSQILGGNMQAFRMLIKMNERLVGHMVGKLVTHKEEHEEICQDVFLKVYNKLSEFNFQSKLSTWIATIAYRHAINSLRKHKLVMKELPENESANSYFVSDEDPESALSDKDMDAYILKLVDQLPTQYKLVLTLYHVEGMNYLEIEEITGMPEGTVKNYLFRARTLLKEKVKKHLHEPL